MPTKFWRARGCRRGVHDWSWSSEVDLDSGQDRHYCKRCGCLSAPVDSNRKMLWYAKNGMVSMKTFFPKVWAAQRDVQLLQLARVVLAVLFGVGILLWPQRVMLYAAALFAFIINTILILSAKATVIQREKEAYDE